MRLEQSVFPDDIGHRDFTGFDRCHDGSHKSADGRTIPQTRDAFLEIIDRGPVAKVENNLNELEFGHPVDVDAA